MHPHDGIVAHYWVRYASLSLSLPTCGAAATCRFTRGTTVGAGPTASVVSSAEREAGRAAVS